VDTSENQQMEPGSMDEEFTSVDEVNEGNMDIDSGELDDISKSQFHKEGVRALASVCAFRLHTKFPYLRKIVDGVPSEAVNVPGWVQPYCEKGTTTPSSLLNDASITMEEIFLKMHGDFYDTQPKVIDRFLVTCKGQHVGLPEEVIKLFGYLRILARIRVLNRLDKKSTEADAGNDVDKNSRQAKHNRIRRS
jgi:hypothetical protein